jgi:predicted outer membrane repeat protein
VFVSTGLVWNCRLLNNTATNGGGVAIGARGGIVRNCLIWGNKATNGGGVYFVENGASGLLESCTIASNYATSNGGGLYTGTNMTSLCVNVVVYQNLAGVVANSNWWTNVNARLVCTNSCVSPTNGIYGDYNIAIDPIFVGVATGGCRLSWGSPCINAGTNQAWMDNAFDLAGSVRKRFGRVDMGAYEWYPYQGMGVKVNGVRYEKIIFINGAEPLRINGVQ